MAADFTRPRASGDRHAGGDGNAAADGLSTSRPNAQGTLRNIGLEPPPPPPLFDTELGQTFFKMRTALSVSVWDMARMVGSDPTVIANLEAGALEELPAWTELTRIVEAYGALSGQDTRPVLGRLMKDYALTGPQITQPITAHLPPVRAAMPRPGPLAQVIVQDDVTEIVPFDEAMHRDRTQPPATSKRVPQSTADETGSPSERGEGRKRMIWLWVMLFALVAGLMLAARLQPRILYALATPWPQAIRAPALAGVNWLVVKLAPTRDGLVWIDTGDPAWRKGDKLPLPGQ